MTFRSLATANVRLMRSPEAIAIAMAVLGYMWLVRVLRYRRKEEIEAPFTAGGRPLSSMTVAEAHVIMNQLQELEFPRAMSKARQIALLKVCGRGSRAGGIPTMSRLFAVTGQNNKRNAGRRAVDTEILLREFQCQPRDSDRYAMAVARINYLHDRYRRANKITDDDLLHTLGDGLVSILEVVDKDEWRKLTDVEKCAIGVFHQTVGEDMKISYEQLPSHQKGWRDGLHFAEELERWVLQYEEEVAKPSQPSRQYVSVYVDAAVASLPRFVGTALRKVLASDMNETMARSLGLETPGLVLRLVLTIVRNSRKVFLRYFSLPRPASSAVKLVDEAPNPETKLYNFQRKVLQPWYMKPSFWSAWSPVELLLRAFGAKAPGTRGDRYCPQGYDLMTIGPEPQRGKGIEEMKQDIEVIKARGVAICPFSNAKVGAL
ncbi:Mycophenolic acid synthesis protein B [Colletotrichum orbiculare MAFF 240422]|uniref:Mycophenolic acid synthesis protein B n=1 Tax=Colletotrichum orbiculare (strain 104-T / ATCC 96160 / CBS 514.97 / LARS 414 / MAFF 240422) TaxID=1213857 RepID=A0A484FI61_COLOR|nr:Mycophenolic acid synthesis protein B [Colletotrichum orbiculare MAFF 240422]